jgi:hypothetical protein
MKKMQRILRVLVASPGDVEDERSVLEDVVEEINNLWSASFGLRLELVKWETHCYPGLGDDAQAVVNDQIGDDYEIFVGILWTRFGTPTKRAASGTIEEFMRAYARYKQHPLQVRVMFYFKDTPIAPSLMKSADHASIFKFQESLGPEGLYFSFRTAREFETLLRMHLSKQLQDWGHGWGNEESTPVTEIVPAQPVVPATSTDVPEEDGFLDLLEISQTRFEDLNEVTSSLNSAIQVVGKRVGERAEAMKQLQASDSKVSPSQIKRLVNLAAQDLENYATQLDLDIPRFAEAYPSALDALGRAAAISVEFSTGDLHPVQKTAEAAKNLGASLQEALESMRGFSGKVQATPRLSTAYNRAKRHALAALGQLVSEMTAASQLTQEVEAMLRRLSQPPTQSA